MNCYTLWDGDDSKHSDPSKCLTGFTLLLIILEFHRHF